MDKWGDQTFVFDFDGVICDSTSECMVSSWNAWQRWSGANEFRSNVDQFSKKDIAWFSTMRPRVRGAGEFFILESIKSAGIKFESQKQYEDKISESTEEIRLFKRMFYEERRRIKSSDFEAWLCLHDVYQDVVDFLVEINSAGRLYIATLKDKTSVNEILESKGIFLADDHLFDESIIESKLDALQRIRVMEDKKPDRIHFIDDNVLHLREPKRYGYNVTLAGWGPVPDEWFAIAKNEEIPTKRTFSSYIETCVTLNQEEK